MTRIINADRELYALKPEAARYERTVSKARELSVLVYQAAAQASHVGAVEVALGQAPSAY